MYQIQFYNVSDHPQKLLESAYIDRRISILEMLTEDEQKLVEQSWRHRLSSNSGFEDNELGSLFGTHY